MVGVGLNPRLLARTTTHDSRWRPPDMSATDRTQVAWVKLACSPARLLGRSVRTTAARYASAIAINTTRRLAWLMIPARIGEIALPSIPQLASTESDRLDRSLGT